MALASGFQCALVGWIDDGVMGPEDAVEDRVRVVMTEIDCAAECLPRDKLSVEECRDLGGVKGLREGISVGRRTAGTYMGDLGGRICLST